MLRQIRGLSASAILVLLTLSSCSDPCTIPLAQAPKVRIINSMPDQLSIRVFIDGLAVESKSGSADYNYTPEPTYLSKFLRGGELTTGEHNIRVTPANDTSDVLIDSTIVLTSTRQTILVIGRGHRKSPADPKTARYLWLNDELASPDADKTLVRYVQAIPDLDTIDVYFSGTVVGQPALTLGYGQATNYLSLPPNTTGLTVTRAGKPNEIVVSIQQAFSLKGLLATIVIRGESEPLGTEPIAAPLVLSDKEIGNVNFETIQFGARLLNATRNRTIDLLLHGWNDQGDAPREIIGGISVQNIQPDSLSRYWPLTILYHGRDTTHYFLRDEQGFNYDTVDYGSAANTRYTIVALQTNPLSSPTATYDQMRLIDSMTTPRDRAYGRVRFLNASPDVMPTVYNGTSSLAFRSTAFSDVKEGTYIWEIVRNGQPTIVTFDVVAGHPATVVLLPSRAANDVPYVTWLD